MIYKLTLDFSSINLNVLVEEFTKNNIEVCFGEDCLYIAYIKNPKMVPISNILRENKIQNYFFKELTSPPTKEPTNYVETWILEKFNEEERIKKEAEQQKTIRKILDDIENFRVLLQQELKTKK